MPYNISFAPPLLESHCIVDCRTPLEFAEDHIPGAVNVPILTDAERVEVGIIHKQLGPKQARIRGLELTCGRFAEMVHAITSTAKGRPILVYCWRGGLRSSSMAILLEMTGNAVMQLQGGYKSFRAHVIDYFNNFSAKTPLIVVHGMTGTGKTSFIQGLDRKTWTAIDLEELACHRGSAFGEIGLEQGVSQKHFDTQLWHAFSRAPEGRPIVLEGESQRIGRITLPGRLYEVMGDSCKVWCHASLETRVRRLTEVYAREEFREPMAAALERIRKKLGAERYTELKDSLEKWDVAGLAKGLIEDYYDRLYYKHRKWTPDLEIELEDFGDAERQLLEYWQSR